MANEPITFGPPRYFVPICVRHAHGFLCGPAGYQEIHDKAEAVARSPIIILAKPVR